MNQMKHIKLDDIKPPVFDARLSSNPEEDFELAESIRELGVLLPLIVKKTGKSFEIVAGHRRFIAAGKVGLQAVPCIVVKVTGADAEAIKLHENLKRLKPGDIDQAVTFQYLIDTYNMTEKQVSALVGKSMSYISQHLTLLHSEPILIQAVQNGKLNFAVAREFMQINDKDELRRLTTIAEENGVTGKIARNWTEESNRETAIFNGEDPPPLNNDPPRPPPAPTFPCMCCDTVFHISKMQILKVCPECDYEIRKAIRGSDPENYLKSPA